MMKFLRSQSQTVLIVVLAVIGLGFLFYGNAGQLLTTSGSHSNDYGRIDGEDLSVAQLYDAVRTTRDSLILSGQQQKLMQPGFSKQLAQEAWGQLLLLHEADRLHIAVGDKELVKAIKDNPLFQKDGKYDPETYKSRMLMIQNILRVPSDSGVDAAANTQALLERIVRTELRVNAVTEALFGNVRGSAKDVSEQYAKYYGPTTVSVVTIDPKVTAAAIEVTPADIEKEFKDNPTNPAYRTKEKRKVDYVLFLLTPEQMKMPGEPKTKAKNDLGEQATKFALKFVPDPSASTTAAFTPPDFATEAKAEGLKPVTTDFFAADAAPKDLPPSPAFNNAAFSLSKDDTVSKVIELENGVAVIHLAEIQGSELRPLAEVKGDIEKELRSSRGAQAAALNAKIMTEALKTAVGRGTDFKTAAAGSKLKVETLPAFVPIKAAPTDQRLQTIAYAATSLKTGEVSGMVPVETDGTFLVIHLDSRGEPDKAGLGNFETRFRQGEDQKLRAALYTDWATWMSKQPGTHKPPELEAYGSVE